MSEAEVKRIFTNPFYCLNKIDDTFVQEHTPLIDEATFIATGTKLINEIGPEEYIKNLLENLKGNFV